MPTKVPQTNFIGSKWNKPRTWFAVCAALLCIAAAVFCILKWGMKETVWEREVPEFRTTLRVQRNEKGYTLTNTRPKKRAADGSKSDKVHFSKPMELEEGIWLTADRFYYSASQNRMTQDTLTLYLMTAEDTAGMRDADWERAGLSCEVRVLDEKTLAVLCTAKWSIYKGELAPAEIGRALALGKEPEYR